MVLDGPTVLKRDRPDIFEAHKNKDGEPFDTK